VTNAAVLTNPKANRKCFLADPKVIPNAAILDPRFTLSMPRTLTVSTALDALTHAIEGLVSTMANPVSEGLFLQAIRLITANLPVVIEDGSNEKARLNMQVASTLAGWGMSTSQLGLAHCMAHTVGAMHHIPHGTGCGIALPWVMRYNVDHATEKLALAAQALGVETSGMTARAAAAAAADEVTALMSRLGHPLRFSDVGVPEENLGVCGFHAVTDMLVLFNPRPVNDPNEVVQLFTQAY
jgi:aldehyde dehydrogenase (NAD+)